MKRPKRLRIWESEPCGRCGAARGKPCRNYKGQRKATCYVVSGCPRCAAQIGRCRHKERTLVQGILWLSDGTYALPVDGYARRYALSRPHALML